MPFAELGMVRVGENNGLDHAPHLYSPVANIGDRWNLKK
jgi:hypothetical protein